MSQIHTFRLANGVRVLVEPFDHVKSVAIGLWCRTGSRHELDHEAGITHLIEHMLFKGTARRTAREIAEEVEGRGGSLNAFTDKENTCYYCRMLSEDSAVGIDVLSDMMCNSLMDPEELEREEKVVLEEIKRSQDEPSDHVHELHLAGRWGEHPLGKPVIGTPESVTSFRREDLIAYMERRYQGGNVLLAVAGNADPETIRAQAEELLGGLAASEPTCDRDNGLERPQGVAGKNEVGKDVEQVHFCIGTDGAAVYDEELYTQAVLDTALGGSMSSRLFQEIREKRGLAYAIGSYSLNYAAGGAYTVYGGTSPENWPLVQELVRQEFDRVIQEGLSEGEIERAKKQLEGNTVLSLEGMSGRMMRMSRNELTHGRQIPVEETLAKIAAVDNAKIIEFAVRYLDEDRVSTTAIGPF
jgi:predicted Zn-dependent peptidase